MKAALYITGIFGTATMSLAQTPKTTLWRITAQDSAASGYLFGTVHSKDDRAYQWGDSVTTALDRVELVAGELDFTGVDKQLFGLMPMAMLPHGGKLKDLYRKRDWKQVEAGLKRELGFMTGMVYRLKPFFVILMTSGHEVDGPHERVLDDELQHRATENGQRVIGLETAKEQILAMDVLPLPQQAQLLLEHLASDNGAEEMDELLDAYAAQDLDWLMDIMEASPTMPSEMNASLIVDRNHRMAQRMDSVLHSGTTAFFAVGAGHLPRATGLIELMRTRGYVLEPIFSVYTKPEEPVMPSDEKH